VDAVASTAHTLENAVSTARSVANVAGQVSQFEVGPPAEWKVVVGDALPTVGEAVVDHAVGAVAAEVKDAASSSVRQALDGVLEPDADPPPTTGNRCPACGNEAVPGKRFCRACGAALVPASSPPAAPPTCPSCGDPVGPNEKFCGACGTRVG
jgi:DNA-directed RNA polymerase subunit M/transcription elongation factor TFIIS